jgi:hypothetical protein
MKKLISALFYSAIILISYGGLKILMPGNVPVATIFFPLAESSAVEDYYRHSAPFFPYLAEEYYWSDLPSGDVGPETQDIHSHLFGASGGTQKSSAIFQKNGAELITLKHRYILFPQIEQVASLSGYAGFSNQEDQTLYPQKEIKRIRAP